jgi:UDP-glucose 4-epimerase
MDESLALAFHQERELDCVIGRFFNTVGPRQQGQYGMVVPRFVEKALSGQPLEVHGDGMQTRSFCHVQDTIRAVAGLMDAREISGQIFNIGSAERVSILELAERVVAATGSASGMAFIPHELVYGLGIEDVLHREPSIEKITAAIGWKPTFDLDRILADVIEGLRAAP